MAEKKRGSLKTVLIAVILASVILTAVIISVFSIVSTINTNEEQTEAYGDRLLEDQQEMLKFEVQTAYTLIEQIYAKQQSGEYTEAQAKLEAANLVRDLKYDDGAGYFWIDTSNGDNVVLLGRDTEGTNRYNAQDPNGVYYIQEIINAGLQDGGGFAYFSFAKPDETEATAKMSYSTYFEPYDWVIGTGIWIDQIDGMKAEYLATAQSALHASILRSVIILIVLIIAGAIVAFYFGDKITKPIIMAANQMIRMSNSDFTENDEIAKVRKLTTSNNEIGAISEALDMMHANIRNLMLQISDTTSSVASASEELSASASQSAEASEMVATSCTNVATSCSGQINAVTGATNETDSFVANMQEFKQAINRSSEMIKSTNEAAINGAADMTNATDMMNTIRESVENSAHVVEDLGESFAVVASEISKLADESNQAAQKINELIAGIMQNSRDAVAAMREGAEEVVSGSELVNEAGGTFNNIVNMVNSISEESNTMSSIVEQLSGGTETIARNIHEIEQMSITVADETSNVSAASQEQTASSYEVAQASDRLAGNAQELQDFVARFSL